MKRFTPGVKSIPIVFSMLDIDDRSLPKIDTTAAFVHNFVPITKRESFWERFQGTMGKRVKEDVKREKAIARKEDEERQGSTVKARTKRRAIL